MESRVEDPGRSDSHDLAESLIDWWALAGVDLDYSENPTDWRGFVEAETPKRRALPSPGAAGVAAPDLRPAGRAPAPSPAPANEPGAPPNLDPPGDMAGFAQWWMTDAALETRRGLGPRIAPRGMPGAPVMIVADLPDRDDSGTVFSGAAGKMLGAILTACGWTFDQVYCTAMVPQAMIDDRELREAGGKWDKLLVHHVRLAQPQSLVLLGDAPNRALSGHNLSHNRGSLRFVNHGWGEIAAIATVHPRALIGKSRLKAEAWRDWQLLLRGK